MLSNTSLSEHNNMESVWILTLRLPLRTLVKVESSALVAACPESTEEVQSPEGVEIASAFLREAREHTQRKEMFFEGPVRTI